MLTFEELVEDVRAQLTTNTGDQEVLGTLTAAASATAGTLTVAGPAFAAGSGFTPGIVEVGEELVYVQAVDPLTGVCTGVLRGQQGTTPAAWPVGTPVRDNPRWTRASIKRAVNQALRGAYPDVYVVKTVDLVGRYASEYELPADCLDVIQIMRQPYNAFHSYDACSNWDFNPNAGGSTGKSVYIGDRLIGRILRVTYKARPVALSSNADDFETVTGLPDWASDLALWGACYRLTAGLDAARATGTSQAQAAINDQVPGRGQVVWKGYLGLYQQEVANFRKVMQDQFPARVHYTR